MQYYPTQYVVMKTASHTNTEYGILSTYYIYIYTPIVRYGQVVYDTILYHTLYYNTAVRVLTTLTWPNITTPTQTEQTDPDNR